MRAWQAGALICRLLAGAAPGVAEPGLPIWNEGERAGLVASGWMAGGLLLTSSDSASTLLLAGITKADLTDAAFDLLV